MKINKKVLIPVFATAMGLSVIGGISGAVAWYQYNSKVTASFVGSSVADTGVLQIGWKTLDSENHEVMNWGRDFVRGGDAAKLVPVTFGELGANNALPAKAYAYPEAGAGEGYGRVKNSEDEDIGGWVEAEEGKHYAQFKVYLRAYQTDATAAAGYKIVNRDVYLSDFVLKSVEDNKVAEEALRVHVAPAGQNARIFSKNAHGTGSELALYGGLDLDKNDHNDKYHATPFNDMLKAYGVSGETATHTDGEDIVYGVDGQKQATEALSDVKASRGTDGKILPADISAGKKLFSTGTSEDGIEVTITVWLEGWEVLKTGESTSSNIWNPYFSAGTDVQLGLQFDTGMFREGDLNA